MGEREIANTMLTSLRLETLSEEEKAGAVRFKSNHNKNAA
jgi:hypothetical protein